MEGDFIGTDVSGTKAFGNHAEGVTITMPLTDEQWGERAFQVRDPNGVIVQLVDWNAPTPTLDQSP